MPGRFITFEGIDGCGKSTQAKLMYDKLVSKGRSCILTREPGGTPIGDVIREIILSPANSAMSDGCELLLYLASRAQHLAEKIIPQLDAGTIVLCDRFQEATFAYQGAGRGIDRAILERLNGFATGGRQPDLSIVFDIPVDEAHKRRMGTGKAPDRLEGAGRLFFERVRQGYLDLAKAAPDRVVVLDATRSIEALAVDVFNVVDTCIN